MACVFTGICLQKIVMGDYAKTFDIVVLYFSGVIIQYDKVFLLALKNSPLADNYPPEIENFPDILVPLNLPRRYG
jgi:hypothetical protein